MDIKAHMDMPPLGPRGGLPRPMGLPELLRRARDVVSLPEVYYRAQDLIDEPDPDLAKLTRIVQSDCGLTARLLKVVNSPLYGLPRRVDRVSYALTLVGTRTLRDLILATSVTRTFYGISPGLVDMSTFWHHSIYCGLIAQRLARRCRVLHDERLLVGGMLHDLGQLVLFETQPALAAEALATADNSDDGLLRAERAIFGYTHADVGARLLESWRMPDNLQAIAQHHHAPLEAGEHALETAIVHLANGVANRLEPGRNILECRPVIEPRAFEITGLTERMADAALSEANEQFLDILDLLLPGKRLP
jgi:putative nucleotidyltransferase with HDIG domain